VGNPLVRFCEGLGNNSGTDEILWHRRETRRRTEKTNFILKVRGGPSLLESVQARGTGKNACATLPTGYLMG
jgi:hypothetical protein